MRRNIELFILGWRWQFATRVRQTDKSKIWGAKGATDSGSQPCKPKVRGKSKERFASPNGGSMIGINKQSPYIKDVMGNGLRLPLQRDDRPARLRRKARHLLARRSKALAPAAPPATTRLTRKPQLQKCVSRNTGRAQSPLLSRGAGKDEAPSKQPHQFLAFS